MLRTTSAAGLKVAAATKQEVIAEIEQRIQNGQRTFLITPYSEFLYTAIKNPSILSLFNSADIAVADGIGILWAETFLRAPIKTQNKLIRLILATWQMMVTGAQILLAPRSVKQVIPETIVGADFFWDLAGIAEKLHCSIFIAGGYGDTPNQVATLLKTRYPNITIAGTSNSIIPPDYAHAPESAALVAEIIASKADFLFLAAGPIKQEQFIRHFWEQLNVKLAVGLGGTFDYITGSRKAPPALIRSAGLEWLYRLIAQPHRYKRIYRATFGLVCSLIRYKVRTSGPAKGNL